MSNEFFVRKGLAIATASVSSSSTAGRVLVLGDDSVVRFRTDYITATGSLVGALPVNSVQLSSATGLTAFGIIDYNRGNISFNRPASLITTSNSQNTLVGASAGQGLTTNANTFVGFRAGEGNVQGCFNTFVGTETGLNNPTTAGAGCNVFVGFKAGNTTITGGNTFVGACVATANATGCQNTFIGFESGKSAGANATDNVSVGYKAGSQISVANSVFIGSCAGCATNGTQNVFIGSNVGVATSNTVQQSVLIGYQAGCAQRNDCNTFVGTCAGAKSDYADSSVFVGHSAGFCTTGGRFNVFVGVQSGYCNQNGCRNVSLGEKAGYGLTGSFNVAIGSEAMYSCNTGTSSVAVGYRAGFQSTGNAVTLLGTEAGSAGAGDFNVYLGTRAGRSNCNISNVFVGYQAGAESSSATCLGSTNNVFVGVEAGKCAIGNFGTHIGHNAGYMNGCVNSGGNNSYIGSYAGQCNSSGCQNTAVGYGSGLRITTGEFNAFLGNSAGAYAYGTSCNTAVGHRALEGDSSCTGIGTANVAVGMLAGNQTTQNQCQNTFVGTCAARESAFATSSVAIGFRAAQRVAIGGNYGFLNVAVGACALLGYRACHNVVVGAYALGRCHPTLDVTHYIRCTTAVGNESGANSLRSVDNVFVGYRAGQDASDTCQNTFVGSNAGCGQLLCKNTFVGYNAGCGAGTGCDNVFVGVNAGLRWGNTQQHTAIGACAGGTSTTQMTGWANTFVGFCAGFGVCGQANTIVGVCAGPNLVGDGSVSGINNNMFGYGAGEGVTTGSFNVFIGNNSFSTLGTICNSIVIGQCARATGCGQLVLASSGFPLGTASMGTFSQFLCTVVNGIPLKIPLYF